jgi:hypothetical protein
MASIDDDLSSDDEDPMRPIHVSGKKQNLARGDDGDPKTGGEVVEWRPSTLNVSTNTKAAAFVENQSQN